MFWWTHITEQNSQVGKEDREYSSYRPSCTKEETGRWKYSSNFIAQKFIQSDGSFTSWINNRFGEIVLISILHLRCFIFIFIVLCCPQYVNGLYSLALPIRISLVSFKNTNFMLLFFFFNNKPFKQNVSHCLKN